MVDVCVIEGCTNIPLKGFAVCTACTKNTGGIRLTNMDAVRMNGFKPPLPLTMEEIQASSIEIPSRRHSDDSMATKYPKYYKAIPKGWTTIDVYGVCKLFPVQDDSGCIHHAVKKLLVPGTRTGGKSFRADIKEARDTLTRWLELNPE